MNTPEQVASATAVQLSDLVAWQPYAGVLRRPPVAGAAITAGHHLSRLRGQGMEFDEVRQYQPGDETGRIDWRVTARTHKPHIKLFREERERPLLQCLDYRPGMFFATRGRLKAVQAAHLAALLAWAGVAHGDRLGGLTFSVDTHEEVRPARGKHGVLRWLRHCAHDRYWASPQRQGAQDHSSGLLPALQRLRRLARPGTTVMLFSDFHGLNEETAGQLRLLARHCECLLCHVYDPLEYQLPTAAGRLPATDGQQLIHIDSDNRQLRTQLAQRFHSRQHMLEELGQLQRLRLLNVSTDAHVLDILRQAHLWI